MLRGVWRKGRNCLVNAERSGMEGINAVTQECPEEYDLWYLALWILKVKNKDLTPKGLTMERISHRHTWTKADFYCLADLGQTNAVFPCDVRGEKESVSVCVGLWPKEFQIRAGRHCVAYRIMREFSLSLSKGLDSEFIIGERFVETKS